MKIITEMQCRGAGPAPSDTGRTPFAPTGIRERILLIFTGIFGAVVLWGSIVLLYGGFVLMGGE